MKTFIEAAVSIKECATIFNQKYLTCQRYIDMYMGHNIYFEQE